MDLRSARSDERERECASRAAEPGRLFLWFPVALVLRRVRHYLVRTGRSYSRVPNGALTVVTPSAGVYDLLHDVIDLLSADERSDTRCVFKAGMGDLDADDIARVRTIDELSHLRASAWFVDMLRDERVTSVFQPIVLASETSTVVGHEALMRGIGEDGTTMSPGVLLEAARGCGLLGELDSAARLSAINIVASQEERRPLFLNFTAEIMRDGARALAPTIRAIDSAEIPRERVVFEVIEAEQAADVHQLRHVVESVRNEGFRVALDDIGVEEHSRRLIHAVRPDFIKLDMERVRRSPLPHLGDAERLLDLAQHLRIETIAEGVETGEELDWNRERGARYVQGYYIAKPGNLRVA